MAHVHFDRHRERHAGASILDLLPAHVRHPSHVNEQVVGTELVGRSQRVERRTQAEAADDVRGDRNLQLASDGPGGFETRDVELAAHDHRQQLVARGEVLLLDAARVGWIFIAGNSTGALEVAEDAAAPRVGQALNRGVGVLA